MKSVEDGLFFDRERVKIARGRKFLKNVEIAKMTETSEKHISLALNGKANVSYKLAKQIAELFETSIEFLTGAADLDALPKLKKSDASADLEEIVRDLAATNPDLVVLLRDTREQWGHLGDKEKRALSDGLAFVFGRTTIDIENRLKKEGRKGPV